MRTGLSDPSCDIPNNNNNNNNNINNNSNACFLIRLLDCENNNTATSWKLDVSGLDTKVVVVDDDDDGVVVVVVVVGFGFVVVVFVIY